MRHDSMGNIIVGRNRLVLTNSNAVISSGVQGFEMFVEEYGIYNIRMSFEAGTQAGIHGLSHVILDQTLHTRAVELDKPIQIGVEWGRGPHFLQAWVTAEEQSFLPSMVEITYLGRLKAL